MHTIVSLIGVALLVAAGSSHEHHTAYTITAEQPLSTSTVPEGLTVTTSSGSNLRFVNQRAANTSLPGWLLTAEVRAWTAPQDTVITELLLWPRAGSRLDTAAVSTWARDWVQQQLGIELASTDLVLPGTEGIRAARVPNARGLSHPCGRQLIEPAWYVQGSNAGVTEALQTALRRKHAVPEAMLSAVVGLGWLGITHMSNVECVAGSTEMSPLEHILLKTPHSVHITTCQLEYTSGSSKLHSPPALPEARLVARSLEGSGAHRMLHSVIEIPQNSTDECVTVFERLPRGAYVDPYELQDHHRLKQGGKWLGLSSEKMDLEAAAPNGLPDLFSLEYTIQPGQAQLETNVSCTHQHSECCL
eukprot:TRINITY_DN8793_c0_g1_i1.p1 TRINITY_DN8793_c0_g1~~TRINITY_DN8793_c0_g1_i1.p1  ORF type:complete len:360 (+),score=55.47 TRINITY_DN8793_c0_g1_i1:174-1253(+)